MFVEQHFLTPRPTFQLPQPVQGCCPLESSNPAVDQRVVGPRGWARTSRTTASFGPRPPHNAGGSRASTRFTPS